MRFTPIPAEDVSRRISRALGHQIRVEALGCFVKAGSTSANRIAKEIGHNTGTVSYHVRVLFEECQLLELVDVQPVRGALEHFFRLAPIALDTESQLTAARPEPSPSGGDGLFMCRPATLDSLGLAEAFRVLREANEKMEKAEAESHRRLRRSEGGKTFSTLVGVAAIEASQFGSAVGML